MRLAGLVPAALILLGAGALQAGIHGQRRSRPSTRARAVADVHRPPDQARSAVAVLVPPPWFVVRLEEMCLFLDPGMVWTAWVASIILLTLGAVVGAGLGAGLLAATVVSALPCLVWSIRRHSGSATIEAALPAAVELVAAGLRSGASLRQAIAESAGKTKGVLGADLVEVATSTDRGAAVVDALDGWAVRRPLLGVRLVVAALCLSAETGGAAARAVDAVAGTLRQRLVAQAEARALATQARLSAIVIAIAPIAFCVLSAAADPRSSSFLLRTRGGLLLLTLGLVLDAAGAVWMACLTRVDGR